MALRSILRCLLLGLAVSVVGAAQADSWARPSLRVVGSADGRALARMVPHGFSGGQRPDVELYAYDAKRAQYALKTRFRLLNRIAPGELLLTGKGELVTLDEWAQVGHGTVLVVYAADGTPRLQRTLAQLLGEAAAAKAPASVSSIWWRCRKPMLSWDDSEVVIATYDDGELRVALATGKAAYTPGGGKCR